MDENSPNYLNSKSTFLSNKMLLRSAVVGLGKSGSLFDEESRKVTWSHAGAYLGLPDQYCLVGGSDLLDENLVRFQLRCPDAKVFSEATEMMSALRPDVLSICTPPRGRAELVKKLLAIHRPKALICEKPLEVLPEERENLVNCCLKHEVPLLVNYNRRYSKVYQHLRSFIQENRVGPLTGITILAPNRLWSIGSHALNLLFYLSGEYPQKWTCLPIPSLVEEDEPACDFICRFPSGVMGRVLTSGFKEALIFEVDILGTQGRMRSTDNGDIAKHYEFIKSKEFMNYLILGSENIMIDRGSEESTFINIVKEAANVANKNKNITSNGKDALICENILDSLSFEFKSDSK